MEPQFLPCAAQVVGVQVVPQTLRTPPPPQVWGEVQEPQLTVPPQPSEMQPQLLPVAEHVVAVHPQTFGVPPPPQVWGAVQEPQFRVPPQALEMEPQFLPCAAHVVGVQVAPPLLWRASRYEPLPELLAHSWALSTDVPSPH